MLTLTDQELKDLTKRERFAAQRRALDAMGIPYRVRHDRTLAVLRSQLEAVGGNGAPTAPREPVLHL